MSKFEIWSPRERAAWSPDPLGPDEIMAVTGLSWPSILRLVDLEGLPVKGIPDHPTLTLEDLEVWEETKQGRGYGPR